MARVPIEEGFFRIPDDPAEPPRLLFAKAGSRAARSAGSRRSSQCRPAVRTVSAYSRARPATAAFPRRRT